MRREKDRYSCSVCSSMDGKRRHCPKAGSCEGHHIARCAPDLYSRAWVGPLVKDTWSKHSGVGGPKNSAFASLLVAFSLLHIT